MKEIKRTGDRVYYQNRSCEIIVDKSQITYKTPEEIKEAFDQIAVICADSIRKRLNEEDDTSF